MKNIIIILVLFLIAQFLGIFVGSVLVGEYTANPYVQEMYLVSENANESFLNVILLFGMILIGTGVLLFIFKHFKNKWLYFIFELFLIAVPASILFYSFLRIIKIGYLESMGLGIVLGLLLALLKFKFNFLKNASAVIASASVGALFGLSFSPFFVIVFLVLLATYDYIAVFKTKHMVAIAKEVLKKDMAMTISAEVKIPNVGVKRIDLGTGDILAPIMLEVSYLQINPSASLLVLAGSFIAVFLIFYLSRDKKIMLPALPPIVAGILFALAVGVLFGVIPF